jgi:hypothetical protein
MDDVEMELFLFFALAAVMLVIAGPYSEDDMPIYYDEPRKTKTNQLPYRFQLLPNGKVAITNVRSQVLMVSQAEVLNMLAREDLDVHRRRMYEAALERFQISVVRSQRLAFTQEVQ